MTAHNGRRGRFVIAFAALLAGALGLATIALADNVQNDVVAGGNDTITAGGPATTINYRIAANSGDGQTGCNAADATPATVTVNAPAAVTVVGSPVTFTACGVFKPVQFSSNTPGDHLITVSVSDACTGTGCGSYNTTPARFTLHVEAAPNTAPTAPGTPGLAAGSATPNQGVFDLEWAASTDPEGDAPTYRLEHADANDLGVFSLVPGAGALSTNAFSFLAGNREDEGTWIYQVRASDGFLTSAFAGPSALIKVDRTNPTAPVATVTSTNPGPNADGWYRDDATVSYGGSSDPDLPDGSSGSNALVYSADDSFATSGTHGYSGTATDAAGNVSDVTSGAVKVDTDAPDLSISGCPTALLKLNSLHKITVDASDDHAGVDSVDPVLDDNDQITLDTSSSGPQSLSAKVTDKVGHEATDSCAYTVNTPPTQPGKPAADDAVNQGEFTLSWDASGDVDSNLDHYILQHKDADDADYSDVANVNPSGGASESYTFASGSPEAQGTWSYRVIAVDQLGDASPASTESDPVVVDRTNPTAPVATVTSTNPGPNADGWYRDDATVSYGGSSDPDLPDGSSGSNALVYSADDSFATSGTHGYSGTATDAAGNVSDVTSGAVKVDADAPDLSISGCPTERVVLNSIHTITIVASDAHSGLDDDPSGERILDTDTIGTYEVIVAASDSVGHPSTASCAYSVIYDWSGFFRPVDNPPVLNTVKAGQAIPVKFSLDGAPVPGSDSGQGLAIFSTGYPRSQEIACDSTAQVDGIDETLTAGGSSLSYDPIADQYVYVWKTEKSWAGKCRQVVVKLADETFHRANFKFLR